MTQESAFFRRPGIQFAHSEIRLCDATYDFSATPVEQKTLAFCQIRINLAQDGENND
jgi:hypothetical protein